MRNPSLYQWESVCRLMVQRPLQAVRDTVLLTLGIPALRIISVSFVMAAITILCGYFASGLGNGIINMISAAIRQLVLLVPCVYSYCMSHKLLKAISLNPVFPLFHTL